MEERSKVAEWRKYPLLDPLKQRLTAYLVIMNDIREKELRLARLEDLRKVTPNFNTLKRHLGKLEQTGYVEHLLEESEHHYVKTRKGHEMEKILLKIWPLINDMDRDWRGKILPE